MDGIAFGVHLPLIKFDGSHRHAREQILTFAERVESLGYDSLSVNDHIVFTTSWLDAVATFCSCTTTRRIRSITPIWICLSI